jgi:hypothetical protein
VQKLVLSVPYSDTYGGDVGERLSAFRSFTRLQHLTHLDLAPEGDAELVAFTSAAAAVSNPQLWCLQIPAGLTFFALMQLQSVHVLNELVVHIGGSQDVRDTFTLEAVRMWLVGLAVVPKLCLVVHSQTQRGGIDAATRWAAQLELPLPTILKVSGV